MRVVHNYLLSIARKRVIPIDRALRDRRRRTSAQYDGTGAHHGRQDATMLASGNVASSPSSPCSSAARRAAMCRGRDGAAACARLRAAPGALLPYAARGGLALPWVMGEGCRRRGFRASDGIASGS